MFIVKRTYEDELHKVKDDMRSKRMVLKNKTKNGGISIAAICMMNEKSTKNKFSEIGGKQIKQH